MKIKEKAKNSVRTTLKKIIYILTFIISLLCIVIFYDKYFIKNKVYAKEVGSSTENIKISNANLINVEKILENTKTEKNKDKYSVEEVELEYITKYRNNPNLPKNTIQVVQEGREGKQQITTKKEYNNEQLVKEEQVSIKVTKAAVDKIVEIGTGNYTNQYKVKVGEDLYVTSDRLSVMSEPNEESQKVATLENGEKLKLIQIVNDWYEISSGSVIGYVKSEATTPINKQLENEKNKSNNTKTKAELIAKLDFNMALNKPSGLSLEQFKKVLSDKKDVNKIFINNAEYFYYIEKQYNINGIFVASIGIHESAWGTSKLAKEKNNLFGYGAYDSNPYNGAYQFSNYSESIDLLARVLVKYYLNPKGTNIYGGEKAVGTYYNGTTVSGVNTKYASDNQWCNKVYQYMKYLYNKL